MEFQALTTIMVYAVDRYYQNDGALVQIWTTQAHSMLLLLTKALQRERAPHQISFLLVSDGYILLLFTHQSNPTVLCNISSYSPLIVKPFRDQAFGGMNYLALAWDKTRRLAQSDRCQAPGCTETHATLRGTANFKSAAVVELQCQQTAWKHSHIPHKPFCSVLAAYSK